MKYRALIYEKTRYYQDHQINDILSSNGYSWIIDAEIENALIEIKDDTLVWHGGTWFYGTWVYGVFMDGLWKSGTWKGGVFKNGLWETGTWEAGVFLNGTMNKVEWLSGEFRGGNKQDVINESFVDREQKNKSYESKEKFSSSSRTYTVSRFSNHNKQNRLSNENRNN